MPGHNNRRNEANAYYTDGNTVRKVQTIPSAQKASGTSRQTRKNRERALTMNFKYILFLSAAAVVTVMMCVNYLQLQAESIRLGKAVTALEVSLDEAKLENDADYYRITTEIDMDYVKEVATEKLGMTYVRKKQIVAYECQDDDYVRQYSDVPEE